MKTYVKRFKKNETGRDFIVGDIHGHFTKLEKALEGIGFDRTKDRLFSVGDLVDRGPESLSALEWLEFPWFHPVQGNHEAMAIDFEAGNGSAGHYAANGGAWNIANDASTRREIALAFDEIPVAIEIDTGKGFIGIVHADVPAPSWRQFIAGLESQIVSEQERSQLIAMAQWSRKRITERISKPVNDVLFVVVGHTPLERVVVLGNVIHIDTGGWLGHEFTILEVGVLAASSPAGN